jgi:hypothetical protein
MDGMLRQVSAHTWHGMLSGWQVWISEDDEGWSFTIGHQARGHTVRVIRARSFHDAAQRARAWIEGEGANEY